MPQVYLHEEAVKKLEQGLNLSKYKGSCIREGVPKYGEGDYPFLVLWESSSLGYPDLVFSFPRNEYIVRNSRDSGVVFGEEVYATPNVEQVITFIRLNYPEYF